MTGNESRKEYLCLAHLCRAHGPTSPASLGTTSITAGMASILEKRGTLPA
jgi:hypothetical protein